MATAETTRGGIAVLGTATIWLTHLGSQDPSDPYVVTCKQVGAVRGMPFIRTALLPHGQLLTSLQEALKCRPRALVVTSKQTLHYLAEAFGASDLYTELQTLSCYTLSHATKELAHALGWRDMLSNANDGRELAQELLDAGMRGPLLYPCSTQRSETLPHLLSASSLQLIELPLYSTGSPAKEKLEQFRDLWRADPPAVVCFFSPSAVRTALEELQELNWNSVLRVALGKSTAEALSRGGLPAHTIANEPTPSGVHEALSDVLLRYQAAND